MGHGFEGEVEEGLLVTKLKGTSDEVGNLLGLLEGCFGAGENGLRVYLKVA